MSELEKQARNLLEQARGKRPAESPGGAVPDPELRARRPILHAFLTDQCMASEGHGGGATLFVFVSEGVFKGVLNDRVTDRSLWGSADTLEGLLDNIEDRLGADSVDWRKNKGQGPRRK